MTDESTKVVTDGRWDSERTEYAVWGDHRGTNHGMRVRAKGDLAVKANWTTVWSNWARA